MIMPTKLLKKIDRLIGPSLLNVLPKTNPLNTQYLKPFPRKLLAIRPGGMGDAIMLLPSLKAAKEKYPALTIDILCEKRNQAVFKAALNINHIYLYHDMKSMFSIFRTQYDILIDTEQSHFLSAIISRFLKAKVKSGFQVNGRDKCYHLSLPYRQDRYEADIFWQLFKHTHLLSGQFSLNLPYFKPGNHLPFPLDHTLNKHICVFPGATINERIWPERHWAQVIDWISEYGYQTILLGGDNERQLCNQIASICKTDKLINKCSKLDIFETTLLFKKATLLISTDSGILHLGVFCGLPTISLFGPGISVKWAPKGNNHITINKNLRCSPCTEFGKFLST